MNTTQAAICVSTRRTFDNVIVELHSDGSVWDRCNQLRGGRLPLATMWRVWDDVCLYTHAELPQLIRDVKAGRWVPFRIRPAIDHEKILREQVRRHVCVNAHGVIVPIR